MRSDTRLTTPRVTWLGGVVVLAGMLGVIVGMMAESVTAGVIATFSVGAVFAATHWLTTPPSGSN